MSLSLLQQLVLSVSTGDRMALLALADYLDETGENMLPLNIGKNYLCETLARWYVLGQVAEVGSAWVRFHPALQIHNMADFRRAVSMGEFGQRSEIVNLPNGIVVPVWNFGPYLPWPFNLPEIASQTASSPLPSSAA